MAILSAALLAALIISIFLDIIRICQYVRMRKLTDNDAEELFAARLQDAYNEYQAGFTYDQPFGKFFLRWTRDKRQRT